MELEKFQQLARMFVMGSLDGEDLQIYERGRAHFGLEADRILEECRRLEAALALSLPPRPVEQGAKQRLLASIRAGRRPGMNPADRRTRAGKDRPLHGATESEMSE